MMKIVALLLLISFCGICSADYIDLNSSQYQINANSCPTGYVCDYAYTQGNTLLQQISQCNSSLVQLFEKDTDNETIATLTAACLRNISTQYTQMTNLYVKQNATSVSAANSLTPSGIFLPLIFVSLFSLVDVKRNKLLLMLVLFLLMAHQVRAEGGEGGHAGGEGEGGAHGEEGGADGHGGYGDHADDSGAHVTSDGHVESGDNYYWLNTAVSSRSHLFAWYIISHNTPTHVVITNTCTVQNVTDYVQDQASLNLALIADFQTVSASGSETNGTVLRYSVTDIIDLFNSLESQTKVLTSMCQGSGASSISISFVLVAVLSIGTLMLM